MQILNKNLKEVLTVKDISDYLRISKVSVIRSESDNTYKHFKRDKKNNSRLYRKSDIEAYLQRINKSSSLQ